MVAIQFTIVVLLIELVLTVHRTEAVDCDLSGRGLVHLNSSIFDGCSASSLNLNLRGNALTHIANDSFSKFYNLQNLDLSDNQINTIEDNSLFYLRSLVTLNLSWNHLESLQDDLLINKFHLNVLDLSHNAITHIGKNVFRDDQQNLQTVNLSHNSLTSTEPWPYIPPNIYSFDLRYNNISSFTNQLNWLYDLREPYTAEVDLRHNTFRYWNDNFIKQYSEPSNPDFVLDLVTYNPDLRDNPWVCDCNFHFLAQRFQNSFYKHADNTLTKIQCFEPAELKDEYIIDTVFLDDFICNVTDDCPPGCLCQDRPERKMMEITCDQWNHTKLPEVLPNNKYGRLSLSINNHYITEITKRKYLSDIVILSLKNNHIQHVDASAIREIDINKLESLDLQNNQISYLPDDIRYIRYDIVNVNRNSFICDCNMTWMADWITLGKTDNKYRNIECTFENKNKYKINEINDNLLNCTYDVEIGLAVAFGLLLIIVIIVVVWAKRCPYETKVLVYKFFRCHPRDKYIVDKNIMDGIDLYISFDDSDIHIRQWVIRKLAKRLEEEKPIYKVFVPVRDLNFAEQTADGIIENMENSKRILIILSEKYDDNEWCRFECQRAELLDFNEGRIIFLKYHPEATNLIENDPWKSRVQGRKIFVPGETKREKRWFWDKLRYELPVR